MFFTNKTMCSILQVHVISVKHFSKANSFLIPYSVFSRTNTKAVVIVDEGIQVK